MTLPASVRKGLAAAVLACCLGTVVLAQDSSQNRPLGDVARKTRSERQEKDHAAPTHVLNEETESAKGELWTVSACHTIPCAELLVRLPAGAKRDTGFVQIPDIRVERAGKIHHLNILAANQLPASDLESAKWVFLEDWFTRPYYFGAAAKLEFDEATKIDQWPAVVTHFTVPGRVMNFRGMALFVAVTSGTFGFACIFREDDTGDATSICEEVLNSAAVRMPLKYKFYTPPSYMNGNR
jgi:hypothetical protein